MPFDSRNIRVTCISKYQVCLVCIEFACFSDEEFISINFPQLKKSSLSIHLNASKLNSDGDSWPDSSLPCTGAISLTPVILQRYAKGVIQGERATLSSADVLCHVFSERHTEEAVNAA